jgi:hypothetical protein
MTTYGAELWIYYGYAKGNVGNKNYASLIILLDLDFLVMM